MKILIFISSILFINSTGFADNCESATSVAEQVQNLISDGDSKRAVKQAETNALSHGQCVQAHLILAEALNARLDDVSGFSALSVSRKYRRAIADALSIEPDNIGARTHEIGYLINAPGIAGGNRRKAKQRIEDLRMIDQLVAAQMQVALVRVREDNAELIISLQALSDLSPTDFSIRSELIRRLILAGQYEHASQDLNHWLIDSSSSTWAWLEHMYLSTVVRVYGAFELEKAEGLIGNFIDNRNQSDDPRIASIGKAYALLGAAREGQNMMDSALETYQLALRHEPTNKLASTGLTRLQSSGNTQ